jgi:hypothetical protein
VGLFETTWKHDDLAADLAQKLAGDSDRMIWTDMQLGPSGSVRPDVYTIPKSYAKFRPITYEVKISVADFRRDVTAGKWQSYLEFSSGVVFAVPAGMVDKAEVPAGCGLIVRGPDAWRTLKAPTLKVCESLPREVWMKLLIDGCKREQSAAAPVARQEWQARQRAMKALGKQVGEAVVKAMQGAERAEESYRILAERYEEKTRDAMARHEKNMANLSEKFAEQRATLAAEVQPLLDLLGIDVHMLDGYAIKGAVNRKIAELSADGRMKLMQRRVENIQRMARTLALEVDGAAALLVSEPTLPPETKNTFPESIEAL